MLLGGYERLERIPTNPFQWKVKLRGALQLAATLVERTAGRARHLHRLLVFLNPRARRTASWGNIEV
jgi:hypothetical protein